MYRLVSNCLLHRGAKKTLIVDIQRKNMATITNEEIDLYVNDKNDIDVDRLKIDNPQFLEFLEINDCIVPSDISAKPINLNYYFPGLISNAVIEVYNTGLLRDYNVVDQLDVLDVESVALILKRKDIYSEVVQQFNYTNITSISLFVNYLDFSKISPFIEFVDSSNRIKSVLFFNSPITKVDITEKDKSIIYIQSKFDHLRTCGSINSEYFSLDISNISESLHHNSCLNRKITIDAEGNIKNCPSMRKSFGNIQDTTLSEAIEKPGFKKYWDINKDKIHVCKDCEFRYICTDCRAYVEDPEDILSKPLKCGYNPYSGEWSEWSSNPLKQKAIDFYGMREIVEEVNQNSDN